MWPGLDSRLMHVHLVPGEVAQPVAADGAGCLHGPGAMTWHRAGRCWRGQAPIAARGCGSPPFPSPPPCSIPVAQGLVCAAAAKADRVEMAGVRRLFTWGTPGLVGGCIVAACAARTCCPVGAHAAISHCGRTADLCRSHAGRYLGDCRRGPSLCKGISGLVAEYIVAIDVTRARFPADACMKGFVCSCRTDWLLDTR